MSTSKVHITSPVRASRRRRTLSASLVALGTATLMTVFMTFGAAQAAHAAAGPPDPVGHLVKKAQKTVGDTATQATQATKPAKSANASVPSRNAPDPSASNDDDSPGHETANPKAPDHASSYVGHGELAGNDLIDVGHGTSTVNDDDSTTADSTLLAVGGQEIIGSHAKSDGTHQGHGAFPKIPVCEQSMGAVCLDLLYSDSYATDNGTSSDSRTNNGVGNVCLGGNDPTPDPANCTAPAFVGLGTSNSHAHRNQRTGRTTASSDSQLVAVCLNRDPVLGTCTVSADVLSSDGRASSDSPRSANRHSNVADLALVQPAGSPGIPGFPGLPGLPAPLPGAPVPGVPSGSDPFAVSVPMDCTSPSVLCIFGNQGETYLGHDLAGTSQSALDIFALDRNLTIGLAHSETLVHNDGGRSAVVSTPQAPHQTHATNAVFVHHSKSPVAQVAGGILPNTGGVWSGFLALGLLLFAAGAFATAWDRRRVNVG